MVARGGVSRGGARGRQAKKQPVKAVDSSSLTLNLTIDESFVNKLPSHSTVSPAGSLTEQPPESLPIAIEAQLQPELSTNPNNKGKGRSKKAPLETSKAVTRSRSKSASHSSTRNRDNGSKEPLKNFATGNTSTESDSMTNISIPQQSRSDAGKSKSPKASTAAKAPRSRNARLSQSVYVVSEPNPMEKESLSISASSVGSRKSPRRSLTSSSSLHPNNDSSASVSSENQRNEETSNHSTNPVGNRNFSVPTISDENVNNSTLRLTRKRRISLDSSESRQISDTRANPAKGILRHPNPNFVEANENGGPEISVDATSPHQSHTSKKRRIDFKTNHDTRYYEPERPKHRKQDLRIQLLKKNAERASHRFYESTYSRSAAHHVIPDVTLVQSEKDDPKRVTDRRTARKRVPHASKSKGQPVEQGDGSMFPPLGNALLPRKETAINFDSITVLRSLINYIEKDTGRQTVEMLLSKDTVNSIFLEKMVQSKEFSKQLSNAVSTFRDQINMDDLMCQLMSATVKTNADIAASSSYDALPLCIWRIWFTLFNGAVTEELNSADYAQLSPAQHCSLGSSSQCTNHRGANTNTLNSSFVSPPLDLERNVLQRVANKIVDNYPDTLESLNKEHSTRESFRNVNEFLQTATQESFYQNREVSEEADKTFTSLFRLCSPRLILAPSTNADVPQRFTD